MSSRVWSRRALVWASIGGVLLLGGLIWPTVWLLGNTGTDDGAGVANVLALPVSVLSLLAGAASLLVGSLTRPRANDPAVLAANARTLLGLVAAGEARTLAQLLGDTGNPRPADVGFAQPDAATLRWRTDGGASTGSLATVNGYYDSLDLGRLVVLGEAGAGKTVLTLRLLLDLAARARAKADASAADDPTARIRVPVRLSLPAFTPPEGVHVARIRQAMNAWVAGHLHDVHGISPAVADGLVADGWILPVLDGLDEMDTDVDAPQRAWQVLAALNDPTGPTPGPVVLACRSARYHRLARPGADETGMPLQDATAIVVQSLDIEAVIDWLAHRFGERGQPDGLARRWQRVATTLRRHPGGRLATCLTSPLRLYLATAVYADPDSTPAELCDLDAEALETHLFDELVPSVTRHHPGPGGVRYPPADVTRWLGTLADHLAGMADAGHSGTDIHLTNLWRTTGEPPGLRIRLTAVALTAGLIAVPLLALGLNYALSVPDVQGMRRFLPREAYEWFSVLLGVALVIWVAGYTLNPGLGAPQRIDLRGLRTMAGLRTFLGGSATGVGMGLVSGLLLRLLGMDYDLDLLLRTSIIGLAFGMAAGATIGLTATQRLAARPSDPLRQTMAWSAVVGGTIALAFGISGGTLYGVVGALCVGLATGLTAALTGALSDTSSPVVLHYVLAVRTLHRAGALPRRLARFVDWAHTAGLLRVAGTAIQFRHRDLQTRLHTPFVTAGS